MAYNGIGPGRIVAGDPTTSGGLVSLGDHEDVSFNPELRIAYTTTANTNDVPRGESLKGLAAMPAFSVQLYNQEVQNLKSLLKEQVEIATSGTDPELQAIVMRPYSKDVTPMTIGFIPREELGDGFDAAHGIWLPAAVCNSLNDLFTYGRLSEGENNNPFPAEIMATTVKDPSALGTDATLIYGPVEAEVASGTWTGFPSGLS